VRISTRGLDLLTELEGLELRPYNDSGGACTVGVGHLIHKGRCGTRPELEAPFTPSITREHALTLLQQDVRDAEEAINRFVSVPLRPFQFDALVCLVFNIGGAAFRRSTLLKRLNVGDYTGAAQQFSVWCFDNGKRVAGLAKRRARERALFEGGYK
jgi:lysozyme